VVILARQVKRGALIIELCIDLHWRYFIHSGFRQKVMLLSVLVSCDEFHLRSIYALISATIGNHTKLKKALH
jgi:hypothetical protein